MKKLILFVGLAVSYELNADTIIKLGSKQRVIDLFSYPNNCDSVCFRAWTLEQTVEHYLNDSLKRDGYTDSKADIFIKDDLVLAKIPGKDLQVFSKTYEQFLEHGDTALEIARQFNKEGKWRYDWRFLLPLGQSMENNKTLEVMDFPPVSLVLETQDYLVSNTTNRWKQLLTKNGVPEKELDQFSAILDIVPVAATAGDGKKMEESGIYNGVFNKYTKPMLALWTATGDPRKSKPIMALGAPMRKWFFDAFGLKLDLLTVSLLKLDDGRSVPIMGTNHPSFFFYAANKYTSGSDKDEKNYAIGLEVMKQDIVAACWQAEMGMNPSADPNATKNICTGRWLNRDKELCVLV